MRGICVCARDDGVPVGAPAAAAPAAGVAGDGTAGAEDRRSGVAGPLIPQAAASGAVLAGRRNEISKQFFSKQFCRKTLKLFHNLVPQAVSKYNSLQASIF